MKRRKLKSSDSEGSNMELIQVLTPSAQSTTQLHPGVVVVDGREVIMGKEQTGNLPPQVAELSLDESGEKLQNVDFNDIFPDEILLAIFKYVWRPVDCWNAAKVCKRWAVLLARNQLLKGSSHVSGGYPCSRPEKAHRCSGSSQTLKLARINSEWELAKNLLSACRRHTHALEIKDCTHVAVRGYQLIAGFVSNLKSIRLESCCSMDDPSLDAMLNRCSGLRSIHLSMVPKLTLRNIEKKVPLLQEIQVYGCPNVTPTIVFSVLNGCPNLRKLCLSAMGVSPDWNESRIVQGPPLRLQSLKLTHSLAVTDVLLRALTERLSNLRRLNLSNCGLLSDDGIKALIPSCGRGLQRLVVTCCPGISDDTVRALAGVAANLQDISLAGTNVSDSGVEALMSSDSVVSKLRNLSVACCLRVTDAGLQHFVSRQNHLVSFKTLDVQNSPGVSIAGLETLRNSMTKNPWNIVSDKSGETVSE